MGLRNFGVPHFYEDWEQNEKENNSWYSSRVKRVILYCMILQKYSRWQNTRLNRVVSVNIKTWLELQGSKLLKQKKKAV